ncbi:hypothetical protein GCM10009559_13830 [Pseudonocardia zijingensis]|uniref:Uncharacterized protein n=1 Tax=Pseudonocardia zijingensis TaxID=153376 RepID=A0ABP3ZVJ2_9PSEU
MARGVGRRPGARDDDVEGQDVAGVQGALHDPAQDRVAHCRVLRARRGRAVVGGHGATLAALGRFKINFMPSPRNAVQLRGNAGSPRET